MYRYHVYNQTENKAQHSCSVDVRTPLLSPFKLELDARLQDLHTGVRRPNRPFAGDQLLGSECGCCLFDVRWPCIINDERLIWDLELRPIIFSVNPFYTDTYFIS